MENEIVKKARNPRLVILERSSLSTDQWKKYMEPPEDVKAEITVQELQLLIQALVNQVTSVSLMIGRDLGLVDWLQGWAPYSFEDMTQDEIDATQHNITIWVRGLLSELDEATGITHSISFTWEKLSPTVYKLHAYLNPPAVVSAVPGSGTGVVTPTQPKQPPPPSF